MDLSRAGVSPDKYAIVTEGKGSEDVCKGIERFHYPLLSPGSHVLPLISLDSVVQY